MVLRSDPIDMTSSIADGTFLFIAPERFTDERKGINIQSDVYSYGCIYAQVWVCRSLADGRTLIPCRSSQIMTGDRPFKWYNKTDPRIVESRSRGQLPYEIDSIISRHNIGFLERSWGVVPGDRPTISNICEILGVASYADRL